LPTIADFKRDLHAALDYRFARSKADAASHPFMTATVLDPAMKSCELFPESLQNAAYDHLVCRALMSRGCRIIASRDRRRGCW